MSVRLVQLADVGEAHRSASVIAEKTAANHVEHIYAKIDVSTRAAAALHAMRHGSLETLEPIGR